MNVKVLVKTLTGSSPEALATDTLKSIPAGARIYADSGDVVYLVPQSDSAAGDGFLLPTTPGTALELGNFVGFKSAEYINLTNLYVLGANTDVVRILYFKGE